HVIEADEVIIPKANFEIDEENAFSKDPDIKINTGSERISPIEVPGPDDPSQEIGVPGGSKILDPNHIPPVGGFGGPGTAGSHDGFDKGNSNGIGSPGGFMGGGPLRNALSGRSAGSRQEALRIGGGTDKSEVAVTKGLQWLARQQLADGRWMLNSP